jgi:hypothetical protein
VCCGIQKAARHRVEGGGERSELNVVDDDVQRGDRGFDDGDLARAAIGPLTADGSGMVLVAMESPGLRDVMYGTIVRTSVRGVNAPLRRLNVWEVDPNDP